MDPISPTPQLSNQPLIDSSVPEVPQSTNQQINHLTILSMAIFVLLSLSAVAFLYYQNQQLKSMLASYQKQATPTPSPAEVSAQEGTVNWETYSDSKYNFSFKYPENSKMISDSLNGDGSLEFNNFILFVEKTNDTLPNYVNKLKDTNIAFLQTTKDIARLPTIEWIGSYKNAPTHYLSFVNSGYAYSFGVTPYEETNVTIDSQLLNQILSTFKFLDPGLKPEPVPSQTPLSY